MVERGETKKTTKKKLYIPQKKKTFVEVFRCAAVPRGKERGGSFSTWAPPGCVERGCSRYMCPGLER